jgi:hypothetical protein
MHFPFYKKPYQSFLHGRNLNNGCAGPVLFFGLLKER